jgi:hypothetical protein
MKTARLSGRGIFAGFGLGQLTAWLLVHNDCPQAPELIALSDFGIGMFVFAMLRIFLWLKRPSSG